MQTPTVGRIVHYVSRGSADGKYAPECRAAIVTEVAGDGRTVGLCVANPSGLFFHSLADGGCAYDEGSETAGAANCPNAAAHGNPLRYCACGWMEAAHKGGTWHWPERV